MSSISSKYIYEIGEGEIKVKKKDGSAYGNLGIANFKSVTVGPWYCQQTYPLAKEQPWLNEGEMAAIHPTGAVVRVSLKYNYIRRLNFA